MIITNSQYNQLDETNVSVNATIDGVDMSVPLDPANKHYAEILRQVADGDLTIAAAD